MLKYIFHNIFRNKKFYIPFFVIMILILSMLLYSSTIRENVKKAHEQHIGKYAAIAIVRDDYTLTNNPNSDKLIGINDEFIKNFLLSEHILDYYSFNQNRAGSDTIKPLSSILEFSGTWENREDETEPFTLMTYSDIGKSTHFRIGDRSIKEGRFAKNTGECNISIELAELNQLTIGDYIEIFLGTIIPQYFDFEIVGIYEDYTEEISNELVLINPKIFNHFEDEKERYGLLTSASRDNISRNQILTSAPTTDDLAVFSIFGIGFSYDVLVYYAHDEESIISYINDIESLLPRQFLTIDSAETLRSSIIIFEETENGFKQLFIISTLICGVLCSLIIFFILKGRTYEISVFRARGMSRIKTAILVSSEVFIISIMAFVMAWFIYVKTFVSFAKYIYRFQGELLVNESFIITGNFKGQNLDFLSFFNAKNNHEIFLIFSPFHLFITLFILSIFTVIVGFAAVLFISRHEPMKTMAEY